MLQQDSESRSMRAVRHVVDAVRLLVDRVGRWDASEGVPRAIRRQQWSIFNVPITWAAATCDRSCGVLPVGVAQSAENLSISVGGCDMTRSGAVFAGWEAWQSVKNSLGIRSREGLSVDPRPGISATSMGILFLWKSTGTHSQHGHQPGWRRCCVGGNIRPDRCEIL